MAGNSWRVGISLLMIAFVAVARGADEFRVVGYLPDYRVAEFDKAAARQLTDLIVFSAEPTADGELELSRLRQTPWEQLRQFKTRHRVRLILCVGGWDRSKHFGTVSTTLAKREKFVRAVVKFCVEQRLDGIDLDWEHPQTEQEQAGYAQLLGDLRRSFEPQGLVLSVTMAAWQQLPRSGFEAAHWVNVMSYDHPGKHSTLETSQSDVKSLLAAGAPAEKITLGLPFYGRNIANPNEVLTYREIVARFGPAPEVDEVQGIYFNGLALIARKLEYAREQGLAGVMIWEIGQDAPGEQSLLRLIRQHADQTPAK